MAVGRVANHSDEYESLRLILNADEHVVSVSVLLNEISAKKNRCISWRSPWRSEPHI
jgi:hypothetical protein